jgi:hypothetical protein
MLRRIYRRWVEPPPPNLRGDRDVEYSWIAANLPSGPGRVLDFGTGPGWSWMGLLAARRGFEAVGVDLQPAAWAYHHPRFSFIQADAFDLPFPPEHFDLIINCSSIEHVGLVGRYGVTAARLDGDLQAMTILRTLTRRGGQMLLTIPVGRDHVFPPLHRVYGTQRLPLLLRGWERLRDEYWAKDGQNRWTLVSEEVALNIEPLRWYYGLGLFVLRRPNTMLEESC